MPSASPSAVSFSTRESSLGLLLVAWSDRGLCAVLLGDDSAALTEELHRHFPRALPADDSNANEDLVTAVVASVDDPRIPLDVPLDIRGTAFQQKVWQALREIPVGTTVSYAQLAEAIGSPTATRAVAGACAANRLAVVIPCHRVVRSDGSLSGYRWGVDRKRELLAREAKATA